MRALVFNGPWDIQIAERPDSEPATAEWLAEAPIDLAHLIDGDMPLTDAPAIFQTLANGTLRSSKVLVCFDGGTP